MFGDGGFSVFVTTSLMWFFAGVGVGYVMRDLMGLLKQRGES